MTGPGTGSYGERYLRDLAWIPYRPDVMVPAFGIVVVKLDTAHIFGQAPVIRAMQTDQPAGFGKTLLVNGPENAPENQFGRATRGERPVYALYDTADGTPAVGDVWGVGDSSFKLRKYLPGFVVLEEGVNGRVLVLHQPFVHIWGKNDVALAYNNSTGVTVSVWQNGWGADVSGQDLTLVLPPKTMTSGEIPITSFVRVAVRADGRYYVDLAPC